MFSINSFILKSCKPIFFNLSCNPCLFWFICNILYRFSTLPEVNCPNFAFASSSFWDFCSSSRRKRSCSSSSSRKRSRSSCSSRKRSLSSSSRRTRSRSSSRRRCSLSSASRCSCKFISSYLLRKFLKLVRSSSDFNKFIFSSLSNSSIFALILSFS